MYNTFKHVSNHGNKGIKFRGFITHKVENDRCKGVRNKGEASW